MPFDTTSYILGKKDGQDDIQLTTLSATQNHKTYAAPAGRAYSRVDVNAPNVFTENDDGGVIKIYNKAPYIATLGTDYRLAYIFDEKYITEITVVVTSNKKLTLYFMCLLNGASSPKPRPVIIWGDNTPPDTGENWTVSTGSYDRMFVAEHTYENAGTYKILFGYPKNLTDQSGDIYKIWWPGNGAGFNMFGANGTKSTTVPEVVSMKLGNGIKRDVGSSFGVLYPFKNFNNLESVVWPESGIQLIYDPTDEGADSPYILFTGCANLMKIELPNLQAWLNNNYGTQIVPADADQCKLYIKGDAQPIEFLHIDQNVNKYAFTNVAGIKSIILEDAVIATQAFSVMPDLKQVWIRDTCTLSGSSIFVGGENTTLYFEGTAPASDGSMAAWNYGFLGTIVENVTECPF